MSRLWLALKPLALGALLAGPLACGPLEDQGPTAAEGLFAVDTLRVHADGCDLDDQGEALTAGSCLDCAVSTEAFSLVTTRVAGRTVLAHVPCDDAQDAACSEAGGAPGTPLSGQILFTGRDGDTWEAEITRATLISETTALGTATVCQYTQISHTVSVELDANDEPTGPLDWQTRVHQVEFTPEMLDQIGASCTQLLDNPPPDEALNCIRAESVSATRVEEGNESE